MAELMAVARRTVPARRGGGLPDRTARGGRGERVISCFCQGLVEETALCARVLFLRCTPPLRPRLRGSPEPGLTGNAFSHTTSCARIQPYTWCTNKCTCTRFLNRSVTSVDHRTRQRTIEARVTVAELRLSKRSAAPTGAGNLSRSVTSRGKKHIGGDLRGTVPRRPQAETPCGACGSTQ